MQNLEKTLYTANASAVAGRDGRAKSDDGNLDVALSVPTGLGGKGGAGTNPEQLFAAGYAACFGSAVGLIARQRKLNPESVTIDATVHIGPLASGAFGLAVKLTARLPGLSPEDARTVVEAAHQVCPYSNATRGNIRVDIEVA